MKKISIRQMRIEFQQAAKNSGVLLAAMLDATQGPLLNLDEQVLRSGRLPASMKLFVRSRTVEQRVRACEQVMNVFNSDAFIKIQDQFVALLKFVAGWKEITLKYNSAISELLSKNDSPLMHEVFGAEHLRAEIFNPVQMRAGRYALLLKDCHFPENSLVELALLQTRLLAAKANQALA